MRSTLPWMMVGLLALGCGGSSSPARDASSGSDASDALKADAPVTDAATAADASDASGGATDAQPDSSGDHGRGDIVGLAECETAADCLTRVKPVSAKWCDKTSAWSCIARKCAWECGPARTCDVDTDGCLACAGSAARQCPGQACPDLTQFGIENMTCATPPAVGAWTCFGDWARLASGEYCSLIGLPTGLVRYAVTCGLCQTIFYQ